MIRWFQASQAKTEDLVRWCKWLGIDPSSDFKRDSLLEWLEYEGYVTPQGQGWRR